jgi:hypothetical protein
VNPVIKVCWSPTVINITDLACWNAYNPAVDGIYSAIIVDYASDDVGYLKTEWGTTWQQNPIYPGQTCRWRATYRPKIVPKGTQLMGFTIVARITLLPNSELIVMTAASMVAKAKPMPKQLDVEPVYDDEGMEVAVSEKAVVPEPAKPVVNHHVSKKMIAACKVCRLGAVSEVLPTTCPSGEMFSAYHEGCVGTFGINSLPSMDAIGSVVTHMYTSHHIAPFVITATGLVLAVSLFVVFWCTCACTRGNTFIAKKNE